MTGTFGRTNPDVDNAVGFLAGREWPKKGPKKKVDHLETKAGDHGTVCYGERNLHE